MELTAPSCRDCISRSLSRFTSSFSLTIALAAWLTVLQALPLATGRPAYGRIFDFWLKIFGVAFGLGVVSGIVLGLEFGTNWSELSRMSGPIQGPLLTYEAFTAFALEASFFGVLLFEPWFFVEFAQEMEAGPAGALLSTRRPPTLYERAPLRFWQVLTALLALALLASLWWK